MFIWLRRQKDEEQRSAFKENFLLLLLTQLPFALIPILTFTSLTSVMAEFVNGL